MSGGEYARVVARSPSLAPPVDSWPPTPPFGIYRLTDPVYQAYVNECLAQAQADARACIHQLTGSSRRAHRFMVSDLFAATVAQKRAIQSQEELARVRFDRVLARLGDLTLARGSLAVPVTFAWLRNGHDAIVGLFDKESAAYAQLLDHREQVRHILTTEGLPHVPMRKPHHVSIAAFGSYFGSETRLDEMQRETVLQVMKAHLLTATVDYVELGETVAGCSYSEVFRIDDWLVHAQQAAEAELMATHN